MKYLGLLMQILGVVLTLLSIPAFLRFSTRLISFGDTSGPTIVGTLLFFMLIAAGLGIWWSGTIIKRNAK